MPLRFSPLLFGICLLAAPAGLPAAADPPSTQADEKLLRDASLSSEGPALLDFFRKRTLADVQREKILALIKQMGDDSFKVREQAFADLLALGPTAAPLLRQAQQSETDIEIVRRAERCLALIEKNYSAAITAAAVRLLAQRKPEGAAAVLLAYLPFAEEQAVVDEIKTTLTVTGFPDGQPDKALLAALKDKLPLRRAVAAEVLLRGGKDGQRAAVRELLNDPDPSVRVRVAVALVEKKDKDAVPVLITLLAEAPRDQCWQAEDLLYRLAGDQAPAVSLGTTDAARRQARDAWAAWWKKHGETLDLAKLDQAPRTLGHTLLVELTNGTNGRVREVGRDGKTRWSIDNLQYPIDAQAVGADRVLVVEYTPRRVSERDLKGEIKWQKTFAGTAYPLNCQRLPNGNTVIVVRNQLLELDREGKEVLTYNRPNNDLMAGAKARDGQYVLVTRTGQCIRVDGAGKEVKNFPIGPVTYIGSHIDVLPNGNVLVPLTTSNKVVEYTGDGKQVWEVTVNQPTAAARLPNGNTLIGCQNAQQILEVDRNGKEVRSLRAEGRLMSVRQR
jgi:hypothetical protein